AGNLYLSDQYRVRKIAPNGTSSTIAGDGAVGSPIDGVPAASGHIGFPIRLAASATGDLYLTDGPGRRILHIDTAGILHIVAANQDVKDGGPATAARFDVPRVAIAGPNGEIYVADTGNHRVRKVGRDGKI